ncbi:sugar transferase [Nocardioides ferulae]|uniref:sugar transferase n=1 Tax=Nocardioides ferulae TaxID=2340821 RepID=UPI000EAD5CAA|nr:sugar transferase [Nocardioides ferulae]
MTILSDRRAGLFTGSPSRTLHFLPSTALVLDGLVVAASAGLAAFGRDRLPMFHAGSDITSSLDAVGPLIVLGWLLSLGIAGSYRMSLFGAGTDEYKRVATASLFTAGLVGVASYLAKYDLSRGFYFLLFGIGLPAVVLGRYALRDALHRLRRHGRLQHRVLIAGSPSHIDEVAAVLRRESWLGYRVVGSLTPAHFTDEETSSGIPVLGNSDDVTAAVREHGADIVFFAGGALTSANQMRRIAWDLEHEDVQVVVAPSVTDVSGERVRIRPVGGLPLMHIDAPRATDASRWGKRLFDIVGSAALLVVASPLFLFAGLWILIHDRGPVLFKQERIGRGGREFACLKFRSMVVNAEELLAELHEQAGYDEGLFKMKDDPRITRPGRWLRRFSLDELPQLVNVLRGDMSLVGPRPPLPLEVAKYEGDTARRLRVRPGMTGLWQVSGRSDLSWTEAIRLDLYYVDNWSMLQDLSILTKTLGAVLRRRGAY